MTKERYPVGHMRGPDLVLYSKAKKLITKGYNYLVEAGDISVRAGDRKAANMFYSAANKIRNAFDAL